MTFSTCQTSSDNEGLLNVIYKSSDKKGYSLKPRIMSSAFDGIVK